MSVFKTTFSRALKVYKSNYSNIPFINVIKSGNSDSSNTLSDTLIDPNAVFVKDNVKVGDIVYNNTTYQSATIINVTDTELTLNADIFQSVSQSYTIFQASSETGLSNQGCYLYIGVATENNGAVTVTTIGGDVVTFFGVASGSILPVQVIKLHATDTENVNEIIALW